MIDFTQIRSQSGGQRQAFEELVCQLARREPTPAGSVFRRVEGSGGDGGVEAYWMLPDGTKYGYQAKFFTRAGDIDWSQVDNSVEQALATHPTITKYIIAIPCDLTDRRGLKGKGQTGWEHWSNHNKAWVGKWLTATGRNVEFIPWTAFDLRDKLTANSADGLRRYWFAAVEFSASWFSNHVRLAIASLDERYHSEDHVDVGIESLFQFATRNDVAIRKLQDHLLAVKQAPRIDRRFGGDELKIPESAIDKLRASTAALLSIAPEFDFPCWQEWDLARWKRFAADVSIMIGDLQSWIWDARSKLSGKDSEQAKHNIEFISRDLHKLNEAVRAFESLLNSRYLLAEQCRLALVEGRAGTGKSHLLGRMAEQAAQEGRPVVMLLGQQLGNQPLWDQIMKRLGIGDIDPDIFLQAMDTAAEAIHKRGLILVDAINEGAGARLWKSEIAEFLQRIKKFPNLVCIITCRSEYVPYVVPPGLLGSLLRFEVRGFEGAAEQSRAASVYMDRRGIPRPATPWLAPEFVNPLFLRSTCLALQRDKKSEFPRGLSGTKAIMAFYIKSVARNLGVGRDGSDDLVPATIGALREIATQMATDRKDSIALAKAIDIATRHFSKFSPPPDDHTWFDVLHRNGLLRKDPDSNAPIHDPLVIAEDVVRFSFQRFQDHLMAEALLVSISKIDDALQKNGTLAFIHNGKTLEWEWQGLVEALSIQIPERYKVELVDVLPGGVSQWWRNWQIVDAFAESVQWREKTAFTARTLELFNLLSNTHADQFSLLIELTASVSHPWNADFLHKNLSMRALPQRDRMWTTRLNDASTEGDGPVGRLIDWCLFGQAPNVERTIQHLCGIALCWFFTSSNRYVRDKATKALVSLFLARSDLFPELVGLFKNVDDPYVVERLFAAAYGACCIDSSHHRLVDYAKDTFDAVFAEGNPPPSILLRDYARGIVELCAAKAVLPAGIAIARCRPPYRSPVPRLTVSEAAVKRIAEKAGGDEILRSCDSFMGDFASYEIAPRVNHFAAVRLSRPQPFSSQEIFARFEAEVIDIDSARVDAFLRLRKSSIAGFGLELLGSENEGSKVDIKKWAEGIELAEEDLLKLLSTAEKRRFRREAAPQLGTGAKKKSSDDPASIDVTRARRWVAKRAYELGWTSQLFPNDSSRYRHHSRERPLVERIGKKYQWIALDELLCRLADNYWIGGRYGDNSKRYETPLDLGFERDIDPTVIPVSETVNSSQGKPPAWVLASDLVLDFVDEERLAAWPFLSDPGTAIPNLTNMRDESGSSWLTLYEHRAVTDEYAEKRGLHGLRQQEFRFLMCVIVAKSDRQALVDFLGAKKRLDVMEWDPLELTDGPFLRESPWRDTWPQNQWCRDSWKTPKGMPISFPVCEYRWESHLDASLPEGACALIPSPWLTRVLGLTADKSDASIYKGSNGQVAFFGGKLPKGGSFAFIDANLLGDFLTANDLECLWLFVGERNAWPDGDNDNAAWRRSEGLCWFEDGKSVSTNWKSDNANGVSKASLPRVTKL